LLLDDRREEEKEEEKEMFKFAETPRGETRVQG
jgi:hypothetical protein